MKTRTLNVIDVDGPVFCFDFIAYQEIVLRERRKGLGPPELIFKNECGSAFGQFVYRFSITRTDQGLGYDFRERCAIVINVSNAWYCSAAASSTLPEAEQEFLRILSRALAHETGHYLFCVRHPLQSALHMVIKSSQSLAAVVVASLLMLYAMTWIGTDTVLMYTHRFPKLTLGVVLEAASSKLHRLFAKAHYRYSVNEWYANAYMREALQRPEWQRIFTY